MSPVLRHREDCVLPSQAPGETECQGVRLQVLPCPRIGMWAWPQACGGQTGVASGYFRTIRGKGSGGKEVGTA